MNRPIGVIDSGVGGLTVVKEIMQELPNETIYFYGDTANCPYGNKTKEEIIFYTEKAVKFLISKNVKLVILACNTATAAALDYLQNKYDISIVGVIDSGANTALNVTKNNNILVLGTNFTIKSNYYTNTINKIKNNVVVNNKTCPSFVTFVENAEYIYPLKTKILIETELHNTKKLDFDTVILGCTHYPIIQKEIEEYYGENINVISPSKETAKCVKNLLLEKKLNNIEKVQEDKFFLSSNSKNFTFTLNKILNKNFEVVVI